VGVAVSPRRAFLARRGGCGEPQQRLGMPAVRGLAEPGARLLPAPAHAFAERETYRVREMRARVVLLGGAAGEFGGLGGILLDAAPLVVELREAEQPLDVVGVGGALQPTER